MPEFSSFPPFLIAMIHRPYPLPQSHLKRTLAIRLPDASPILEQDSSSHQSSVFSAYSP